MGRRTIEPDGRKLNLVKVFSVLITFVFLIVLIYFSIKSIKNLNIGDELKDDENIVSQEDIEVQENKVTIEEIVQTFGGEVKKQTKKDTYYITKDGLDYTVYLDGEVSEGQIVPWDGSEAKPAIDEAGNINIYSAAELAWIANRVISGEKNFSGVTITLRKNIDLGARKLDDGTWDGPEWKAMIGFLDEVSENKNETNTETQTVSTDENVDITNENLKRFAGAFNGNGCSIRGMKITSEKRYQGLFGYLSGVVSNLTIKHSCINANEAVGMIAGLNDGKIINCTVTNVEVNGTNKVGGAVGVAMTDSQLENISVSESCVITGKNNVGGIVGYTNNNVFISSCSNGANIIGNEYVGGITGISFYGTTIQSSFNFSSRIEGEKYVGGLVGYSAAQIEKSHNQTLSNNKNIIKGKNYIGGIVGLNYEMGDINECFNNGTIVVTGDNCGGIAGVNNSNISNCYNKGEIECDQAIGLKIGGICGQNLSESFINNSYNIGTIKNVNYAGGLIGADFGTINNSFCLDTVLKTKTSDTEYNKTQEELKNNVLQELGESFEADSDNMNSGFPILKWQ